MPQHPLIFFQGRNRILPYTGRGVPITPRQANIDDRPAHIQRIINSFDVAWAEQALQLAQRSALSLPARDGIYLEVSSEPGCELAYGSLESLRSNTRLLNIRTATGPNGEPITYATIFIPFASRATIATKLLKYAETIDRESPKNKKLVESINGIRTAIVESFWTDDENHMPGDEKEWCEIWLQGGDPGVSDAQLRNATTILNIECMPGMLNFPERTVILCKVNKSDLQDLLLSCPHIAEFRFSKESAQFFTELENFDQQEWAESLLENTTFTNSDISVCILDTGINAGHPLLAPVLPDENLHTALADWGTDDHNGHGSQMAGIAAYGNLADALASAAPVEVNHQLESCKILPRTGGNPYQLYGFITKLGVTAVESASPERTRTFCMPVTAPGPFKGGSPTSWSGAIDQLASGFFDQQKRLFVISAGNVDPSILHDYPSASLSTPIPEPAQAWNAVTVGAYTEMVNITDPDLRGYIPLAAQGNLSPFSATSSPWGRKWPYKPDVVMEGGNLAVVENGDRRTTCTESDCLSLLTTTHTPQENQFTNFNQTSAATALASEFAVKLQCTYPGAWPETIRALMIHSAEWTSAMLDNFAPNRSKTEIATLRRICGYGVPSLSRAAWCMDNSLVLVAERELQPFRMVDGTPKTHEMHIFTLPWPTETLMTLGETPVTLRITLSYFIEPSPGEIGWKDRYRYPSHGLRFDLNLPNETTAMFAQRISAAATAEENGDDDAGDNQAAARPDHGSARWTMGKNSRATGSIHSDIIQGTAIEIAACNMLAVYPQIGWWRERHQLGRINNIARYSLIVSLRTPDENIDIYTPVATELGIIPQVDVPIQIEV